MISVFSLNTCILWDMKFFDLVCYDIMWFMLLKLYDYAIVLISKVYYMLDQGKGLIAYWALSHKTKPNIFRRFGDWRGDCYWGGLGAAFDYRRS